MNTDRTSRRAVWCAVTLAAAVAACDKPRDATVQLAIAPVAARVEAAAAPLWRATTRPDVFVVGDLLEVRIEDMAGASRPPQATAWVKADGTVPVQLFGPVPAAGRTAEEVCREVKEACHYSGTLDDVNVDVFRLRVAGTGGAGAGPIGNYDLIRCEISGVTDKDVSRVCIRRVNGKGELAAPIVGSVKVAGSSDTEAAAAINGAFQKAAVANYTHVGVLTLERAPADAEHKALPDGPIDPVPEAMQFLYVSR